MDKKMSPTLKNKIMEAYTTCCLGISKMNGIQAKSEYTKLALLIHSMMDNEHENLETPKPSLKKKSMDQETQTSQPNLQVKDSKLYISEVELKRQSERSLQENDELLEETVKKYENLIQSLYKQIEDQQKDSEDKLASVKEEYQKKLKLSEKKIPNGIKTQCSCETRVLEQEIDRLKKQIKKRDKQKIKRLIQDKQN